MKMQAFFTHNLDASALLWAIVVQSMILIKTSL